MTQTDWHASPALLHRFAVDPAGLDDMTASSIEAHLVTCAACRGELTAAAPVPEIAASWAAIADRIDQRRPALLERLLHRVGVTAGMARLLAATPALQAVGMATIAALAIGAAVVSRHADAEGAFLVLAPLAPLLAVAASFAPIADPAGEASVATPLHGFGLVVRRAAAVLTATFFLLGVATLAVPNLGLSAVGWVLPSLALVCSALALGTWVRVDAAVGFLTFGWIAGVWWVRWISDRSLPYADSPTFTLAGQMTALAVAAVAATVVIARRDRYASLEAYR